RLSGRGGDPEIAALDLFEVAGEIRHDRDRQVLDRTGRRTANGRRDASRAVRGHDDARRAGPLRAAADGAQVAGVADLVEAGEERALHRGELVGVGVVVGLTPGEGAL